MQWFNVKKKKRGYSIKTHTRTIFLILKQIYTILEYEINCFKSNLRQYVTKSLVTQQK